MTSLLSTILLLITLLDQAQINLLEAMCIVLVSLLKILLVNYLYKKKVDDDEDVIYHHKITTRPNETILCGKSTSIQFFR